MTKRPESRPQPREDGKSARIAQEALNAQAAIGFFLLSALFIIAVAVLSYFVPPLTADRRLSQFIPHILLLSGSLLSALAALAFLEASNPSVPDVMPPHDRDLLKLQIQQGNDRAIDLYMRLRSLRGITGFFQKLGLSGLPLATIFLTLFFALLALLSAGDAQQALFDFVKLTLGAFIGSFVQSQVRRGDQQAPPSPPAPDSRAPSSQ